MTTSNRFWRVVVPQLLPAAGLSLVLTVGLASSLCVLGLFVVHWTFGAMLRVSLRASRLARGLPVREGGAIPASAGTHGILALAALLAAMASAAAVASHAVSPTSVSIERAVGFLAAMIAALGVGAAGAPLIFAAPLAADESPRPIAESYALASRIGLARAIACGVGAAFAVAAPLSIAVALFASTDQPIEPIVLIAAPIGIAPGALFALAMLSDRVIEHRAETEAAEVGVRRLWAIPLTALPIALVTFCAIAFAAATPIPMEEIHATSPLRRGLRASGPSREPSTQRLPGTSVTVRSTAHGLDVEADDGGGAGAIDVPFDTTNSAVYVHPQPDGSFELIVATNFRWARTRVDRDGVRLDDDLRRRVFDRIGRFGSFAIAIALLLALVLVFRTGADLGEAQTLSAPKLDGTPERRLRALEGVLRIADPAQVDLARGGLVLRGAHFEAAGGALRWTIERFVPVAGELRRPLDGERAVLLSRFDRSITAGMRELAQWPDDGRLVLGEQRDAVLALLERARRRAAWLTVAIFACCALAIGRLALALS